MPVDRRSPPSGRPGRTSGWLVVPSRLPRPVRLALWLLAAGWLTFLLETFPRSGPSTLWDAWVYNSLTGGCAAVVLTRAVLVRRERMAWAVLGVGLTCNVTGDITWSLLSADGEGPFPSLADAFYLALYPCLYVALVLLLRERMRRFRLSSWLDGLIAACGLTAVVAAALPAEVVPNVVAAVQGGATVEDAIKGQTQIREAFLRSSAPGTVRIVEAGDDPTNRSVKDEVLAIFKN